MSLPDRMSAAQLREYQRTGRVPLPRFDLSIEPPAVKPPRRSKYNVGPRHLRQLDGYTFDSVAERRRYEELRALELAGVIVELRVHPCWPLVVNGVAVGEYEADFSYYDSPTRHLTHLVVEDVKGVRTAVYALKKKLLLALHSIEVQEVKVTK